MAGRTLLFFGFVAVFLNLLPTTASAQAPGRVLVTVSDATGGVLPAATVTVIDQELATSVLKLPTATTSPQGVATLSGLAPGRYTIQAEFQGFETTTVKDVQIRSGDNRVSLVLPLSKLEATVTVGTDRQAAAADRTRSFATTLNPDQIAALPDDPDDLRRQILDVAGPDAIFRIDSFEGQDLPPKAQIKSIHVTRDQFAAETANAGSTFVDIITQPGVGPVRGGGMFSFRDGSMSAKSPFNSTRGPEQIRGYGFNIGGALVKDKSNFSVSMNGRNAYSSPDLNAVLLTGTRSEVLNLRQPNRNLFLSTLFDYALTRDQTLRFGYSRSTFTSRNNGVGSYDLPERAFSNTQQSHSFRALEAGPIGRRSFINTRLNVNWASFKTESVLEAPTIVVQDAFRSGGAQQAGGWKETIVSFASDLDHIRGMHSWRTGIQIDTFYEWDDRQNNYLGTYTFTSLDAFQAGQPALYTRRVGNPEITYFDARTGVYLQDDIRIARRLTLSPGVRYSIENHVDDHTAVEPRFGFTWTPRNGTAIRGSVGIFHFWMPLDPYAQTLQLDGQREREVSVVNPAYPELGGGGEILPSNKYVFGDIKLGKTLRYSAGVEHTFSPRARVNVLYNYQHSDGQHRGRNLNAPVDGVRRDPSLANVIESITDGEIRRHEVSLNANYSLFEPGPAANRPGFNWRRLAVAVSFSTLQAINNAAEGVFGVSPSGNLDAEWGPGPADMPYRINLSVTSTQIRNVNAFVGWVANDGTPYTWTTGFDDNQDGLLNDRPAGVGPRSLRTPSQSTWNGRLTYTVPLQPQQTTAGQPATPARFRASLYLNVANITNRANLTGYSGNARSPFFMSPTRVLNPRKVDMGVNFNF